MLIRFTARQIYETGGPGIGPVFEAGSVHDMSEDQANRWLRRGVAVFHVEPVAAPVAEPAPVVDIPRRGRPRKVADDE